MQQTIAPNKFRQCKRPDNSKGELYRCKRSSITEMEFSTISKIWLSEERDNQNRDVCKQKEGRRQGVERVKDKDDRRSKEKEG